MKLRLKPDLDFQLQAVDAVCEVLAYFVGNRQSSLPQTRFGPCHGCRKPRRGTSIKLGPGPPDSAMASQASVYHLGFARRLQR